MISNNYSLSHLCEILLSNSCATVESVCVCVPNRESHSLFILVFHLNFTLIGPTSLGESNNPNIPQLWGLFTQHTMEG